MFFLRACLLATIGESRQPCNARRHAACVSVWDCGKGSRKVCRTGGAVRIMIARIRLSAVFCAFLLPLAPALGVAETVLRFIPKADLRSLDPIWTTAYVTRNFG